MTRVLSGQKHHMSRKYRTYSHDEYISVAN
uniref:Uncharacterized protein n=1 Tax=Arundo donax TaxID=35708 RepID=A0A0A8ZLI3_ARUDO